MVYKILKWKVCEFTTFLLGIERRLELSNVKCFIKLRLAGSFSLIIILTSMPLQSLFWQEQICFFTEEFSLLRCSFKRGLFAWLINSNFPFLFLFLSVCLFVIFAVLYDNKFAIRSILSWFDQFKICKMVGNRP